MKEILITTATVNIVWKCAHTKHRCGVRQQAQDREVQGLLGPEE